LLINKKRYAGLYWTNPDKYDKMDAKGIETVRRDNCLMVSNVVSDCLKKLLIDRDIEGAKTVVRRVVSDLLQNIRFIIIGYFKSVIERRERLRWQTSTC